MNRQMVAKYAWAAALLLVIAAPLSLFYINEELLFPFISGKNFLWRALVGSAFVLWIGSALLDTRYRISLKNPILITLGTFLVVTLLSNLLSGNPGLAFWSTVERMDGYIGLLHIAAYLITLVGVMREKKHMWWFLLYLLGISLVLGISDWGSGGRIDSTLGNPIYLASVAMFGVCISGYLIIKRWVSLDKHGPKNFLALEYLVLAATLIASLVTIFQTSTRGALLGLVIGALFFSIATLFVKGSEYRGWKKLSGIILITIIGLSTLLFGGREFLADQSFVQESTMLSRIVKISPEDRTTSFRLANWQMALEGVVEKPLVGYGQEGYAEVFSKYFDVNALANAEQWYDRTHNVFIDALVFGGIIGFAAYVLFFVSIFFFIYKTNLDPLEKIALGTVLVAYLGQNIVAFDSLASGVFLAGFVAYVISRGEQTESKEFVSIRPIVAYGAFAVLIGAAGWWMHYSIITPHNQIASYIQYLRTTTIPNEENMVTGYPDFVEGISGETFAKRELLLQAIQQEPKFRIQELPSELRQQYLASIITEMAGYQNISEDTRMLVAFGLFLSNLGAPQEGLLYLERALERSPNKPFIISQTSFVNERVGNTDRAEELLIHLQSVAPHYEYTDRIVEEFEERNEGREI